MRTLQHWLDDYGQHHQNKTNKAIHWICIPVIFFSSLGLLASIPHHFLLELIGKDNTQISPYVHFGSIVILFALVFYIRLSITMALGMLLWSLFCLWGNVQLEIQEPFGLVLWQISLILFGIAWAVQFIGHKIEGKKPSFFNDIQFLLIGPAWLLHFIYKKVGVKF